jgi:hypothetical protein
LGIPPSGTSGNLSLTTAVVRKCCSTMMAIVGKCYSPTTAVVPLSPLHHITYANSLEFRNLLKWLRMSSLPQARNILLAAYAQSMRHS